jgi:hypothetical protein
VKEARAHKGCRDIQEEERGGLKGCALYQDTPPKTHTGWIRLKTFKRVRSNVIFFSFLEWRETWVHLVCRPLFWPIVPVPGDRWCVWSSRWNENWQGKPKHSEETCAGDTLSTTNPTSLDLGSNPGRRGEKPATNRLSYVADLRSNVTEIQT